MLLFFDGTYNLTFKIIPVSSWKCLCVCLTLCLRLCSYLWSDSLAVPDSCCHNSLMSDSEVVRWGTQITLSTLPPLSDTATGASGLYRQHRGDWHLLKFYKLNCAEHTAYWAKSDAVPLDVKYLRTFWAAQTGMWLTESWRLEGILFERYRRLMSAGWISSARRRIRSELKKCHKAKKNESQLTDFCVFAFACMCFCRWASKHESNMVCQDFHLQV